MEILMFVILFFTAVCLSESIVILVLAAKREKAEKPEEKKHDEYEDYLEKLWQQGLNGIMSYGIDNAMGKRRSDE